MRYDEDIDKECVPLCDAINSLKGLFTTCSCCGHGKEHFRIWFKTESLRCLPDLLYWLDVCHTGFRGWKTEVYTDCAKSPVTFMIEGPIGEEAYIQSKSIAELITNDSDKIS